MAPCTITVVALMIPFFFFADFSSHLPTDGADAKDHCGEKLPVKGCIFSNFYALGFPTAYNDLQKHYNNARCRTSGVGHDNIT